MKKESIPFVTPTAAATTTIANQYTIIKNAVSDSLKKVCQNDESLMVFFFNTENGKLFIQNIAIDIATQGLPKLPWVKDKTFSFNAGKTAEAVRIMDLLRNDDVKKHLYNEFTVAFEVKRTSSFIIVKFENR